MRGDVHRFKSLSRVLVAGVWLSVGVLTVTSPAQADKTPSEIDRDAARTLVQQGDERMAEKDYRGALVAYQRADDIMGVPTTSIEVGRAHLKLGHLVEAYAAFRRAWKYPKKKKEPTPFTRAREEAKTLAKETKKRIPRLTVDIEGIPPDLDVEVTIDGEPVDGWGGKIGVNPGLRTVVADAPGFQTATGDIVMVEGESQKLTMTMKPVPKREVPGAKEPSGFWPMAWVGFSVAGAGVVVGAITGGLSLADAAEAKDLCEGSRCPPEAQAPLDSSRTLAHVSTASFVVAGVGAAIGLTGLILSLGDEDADGGDELSDDEKNPDTDKTSSRGYWLRLGLGQVAIGGRF